MEPLIYSQWVRGTGDNPGLRLPSGDFPGGAVVKNLLTSAGDRGSSPGQGRSRMMRRQKKKKKRLAPEWRVGGEGSLGELSP